MRVDIRPATMRDHEGINRIAAEAVELHGRAYPERFRLAAEPLPGDQLRSYLESEQHHVLVAARQGTIVAYERIQIRTSPDVPPVAPRRFVVIDELAVTASERRQGIGRLLVEAAAAWARTRGASSLELNVWEFNESAIAFYERLGFGTLSRIMALSLDTDAHRRGER